MSLPAPAAPHDLVVTLRYATVEEFDEGFAPCVARDVVFIKSKVVRAVGSPVRVQLRLRDGFPALILEGTVLWSCGPDRVPRGRSPGMGIRAEGVDEQSRARLAEIVRKHGAGTWAAEPGQGAWAALKARYPRAARDILGGAPDLTGTVESLHRDLDDAFQNILGDASTANQSFPPMPVGADVLLDALRAAGSSAPLTPPIAPPRDPDTVRPVVEAPAPPPAWKSLLAAPDLPRPPPSALPPPPAVYARPVGFQLPPEPAPRPLPQPPPAAVPPPPPAVGATPTPWVTTLPPAGPPPREAFAPTLPPALAGPPPSEQVTAPPVRRPAAPVVAPAEPPPDEVGEDDLMELADDEVMPLDGPGDADAAVPPPDEETTTSMPLAAVEEAVASVPSLLPSLPPADTGPAPFGDVTSIAEPPPREDADAAPPSPVPAGMSGEPPPAHWSIPISVVPPESAPPAPVAADAPAPVMDAPAQAAEEPAQSAEAHAQVVEAPAQVVEVPAQVVEAPAQVVEAPAQVVEAPAQVAEEPAQVAEEPAQVAEVPAQVAEAPAQVAEEPLHAAEVPAQGSEAPAQVAEAPVQAAEEPAPPAAVVPPEGFEGEGTGTRWEVEPPAAIPAPMVAVEAASPELPWTDTAPEKAADTGIMAGALDSEFAIMDTMEPTLDLPLPGVRRGGAPEPIALLPDEPTVHNETTQSMDVAEVERALADAVGADPPSPWGDTGRGPILARPAPRRSGSVAPVIQPLPEPPAAWDERWISHVQEAASSRPVIGWAFSRGSDSRHDSQEHVAPEAVHWPLGDRTTREVVVRAPVVEETELSNPAFAAPDARTLAPPPLPRRAFMDAPAEEEVFAAGGAPAADEDAASAFQPLVVPSPAEAAPDAEDAFQPSHTPPPVQAAPPQGKAADEEGGDGWADAFAPAAGAWSTVAPPSVPPAAAEAGTHVGPPPRDDGDDSWKTAFSSTPTTVPGKAPPVAPDPEDEPSTVANAPNPLLAEAAAARPPVVGDDETPPPPRVEKAEWPQSVLRHVGIGLPGGRLRRVVSAGDAIPVHWKKDIPGDGEQLVLHLFESPSDRAEDGHELGHVVVKNPRGEDTDQWHVEFHVDEDAVLKVRVHAAGHREELSERVFALENTTARGRARVARAPRDEPPSSGGGGFFRRLMGR